MVTTATYSRLQEAIKKALQVRVSLFIPTSTWKSKEDMKNYRDCLEIPDLLDDVSKDWKDILSRSTNSEKINELLPKYNPNQERMVYQIEVVEDFGQAPIRFRSNFDYSVIEEYTQYITVCTECGSDSIVGSKYGTDDGWCDKCNEFMDQEEITEKEFYARGD